MARKADPPRLDPEIVALVGVLEEERQELIDGMVDRIQKEISFYRAGTVDRTDLWASCDTNVRDILGPLITGRPVDLTSPCETGTRRAAQHAPLPAVMAAYRIGFRHLWEAMVTYARRRGLASSDALVGAASTLWAAHDTYTDTMTTAYRDAMTTEMIRNERERSALVDALLDGRLSDMTDIWDAAELLRLPSKGTYVVIAAEVPQIAHEALPGAEPRLAGRGIGSAWCLRADLQVGVACLPAVDRLTILVTILQELATARVGISPGYPTLDQTAPANVPGMQGHPAEGGEGQVPLRRGWPGEVPVEEPG
jgi:GGDEF-like domain